MFQLEKAIVSDDVLEKEFVCNLSACKGACCVDGDAGAPLEDEELEVLKEIFPKIKPFLSDKGIEAIESQGHYTTNEFGEHETTLIDGADCAYVVYDNKGAALCGIEEAYNQGEIAFKKPISCHLYPIRLRQYTDFVAVNYHQWEICDDACTLGQSLEVPVYRFLKEALIRKFGQEWYHKLEALGAEKESSKR